MDRIKKNFGFGCMRLPMIGEEVDIEQTKQMVDAFLDAGFNYFDTAHGYIQGKSETALDLIQSGHRLVADDVVEVSRLEERLGGRAPNATKHIMDVRGIGIIDVRYLYGMSAILPEKDINLVIDLKKLEEYLDTEEKAVDAMDILGLPVPLTPLPISPGRNVAVLVEVAVRNFRLKHMGFDSEREFELKLK